MSEDKQWKDLDKKRSAELLRETITDQNKMAELSVAMAHTAKCEYCRELAKMMNILQALFIKHSKEDGR